MKNKRTAMLAEICPDLLQPPHITHELFHLIMGELQADLTQQDRLTRHFVECYYCRTTFIILLTALQTTVASDSTSRTPVQELLLKFVSLDQTLAASGHAHIGAYAEAIASDGQEKADTRFPALAEHIKTCPACQSALEDTLDFLNEPEESH